MGKILKLCKAKIRQGSEIVPLGCRNASHKECLYRELASQRWTLGATVPDNQETRDFSPF